MLHLLTYPHELANYEMEQNKPGKCPKCAKGDALGICHAPKPMTGYACAECGHKSNPSDNFIEACKSWNAGL